MTVCQDNVSLMTGRDGKYHVANLDVLILIDTNHRSKNHLGIKVSALPEG